MRVIYGVGDWLRNSGRGSAEEAWEVYKVKRVVGWHVIGFGWSYSRGCVGLWKWRVRGFLGCSLDWRGCGIGHYRGGCVCIGEGGGSGWGFELDAGACVVLWGVCAEERRKLWSVLEEDCVGWGEKLVVLLGNSYTNPTETPSTPYTT